MPINSQPGAPRPAPWRRVLQDPFHLLVRTSLILALFGGFGLGWALLMSFALRVPLFGNTGALIQAHGQVQALGFIALLIMAVATRLVPAFHGAKLVGAPLVSVGGLTLASGVVLRAVAQPLPDDPLRNAAVGLSGVLVLGGVLLAFVAFGRTVRAGKPRELNEPMILPLTMAASLLAALLLNLIASIGLAQGGNIVPSPLDDAMLHFELWGFAATMVLAIGRHTWPNLLLLAPARERFTIPSLALWAIGALGVPLAWLLLPDAPIVRAVAATAQLAGAVLYAHELRLFEPPARATTIPRVTNPPRLWIRLAFGFLLLGAAANVLLALSADVRSLAAFVNASAARHALAQGFLVPIIVFMAARILPGFSTAMVRHPGRLNVLMGVLFAGALLRVGGEMIGGYGPGWNVLVGAGGTLGAAGFVAFAVGVWRAREGLIQVAPRSGIGRAL
jgi:hypothetical protein